MPSIKSLPTFEQPREKFIRKGFNHLTDADVLSLIISTGTKELSALELSGVLLAKYDYSLLRMARCSYPELMKIKGIGEATALKITAAFELGRRKLTNKTVNPRSRSHVVRMLTILYEQTWKTSTMKCLKLYCLTGHIMLSR